MPIIFRPLALALLLVVTSPPAGARSGGLHCLLTPQAQHWVDSVMNSLTLRQRIAQLFMVAAYSNRGPEHVEEIARLVREDGIGGLCFFQGGPGRQAHLTNYFQRLARVPLLIAIDAEWGLGMRLDSTISYPRQMMLGAADDPRLAYHMGADIARQLRRIGVHVNFAPVVDINNNPLNPVIHTRAFGEDRDDVTQNGLAYMLGLQDNGVLACAKHFPGHGDTDTDSHYALPLLHHSRARLDSLELYPFRALIANGVAGVMTAHLEIPALEPTPRLAASLSAPVVTQLLTQELGFNGLIFTDALNMQGVSDFFKPVELNYRALLAGNDVILFPSEVRASIDRIEREVRKGRFPEEEINRRARKVIEAKYRVGLSRLTPIDTRGLMRDLNTPQSELLIRQIVERAVTIVRGEGVLPLMRLDTLRIAYVEVGAGLGTPFRAQLELYAPISAYTIQANAPPAEFARLLGRLQPYNLVILGHHSLSARPGRNFGVTPGVSGFVSTLASRQPLVLTLFGTPYALDRMDNLAQVAAIVVAYDNTPITQSVTAQIIFGAIPAAGRLPVSLASGFARGTGVTTQGHLRLKYSIPEEVGIPSATMRQIDSIALNAIQQQATPGMQILVARHGVVFYHRAFGTYTYAHPHLPVDLASVYDVASLTKIIATLPVVMDLYAQGLLCLDAPIGRYVAIPDTSPIWNLRIHDILLHQSGLPAWIPFYQRALTSLLPNQPLFQQGLTELHALRVGPQRFLNRHFALSEAHFSPSPSPHHPIPVAQGLYARQGMADSVLHWILQAPLAAQGRYVYSDLGFILLHRALDSLLGQPLEQYLTQRFFRSLGMGHTLFNPLTRLARDRIVPTENDLYFRRQLLWGHVHDPAAAMLGGVSGHAGLFSTANDMAIIMQMFLNRGHYGGKRYLPEATIDRFTSCPNCKNGVRRGLGFDKPEPDPSRPSPVSRLASSLSFGHSGFTGVLAWADPAHELLYVFVSNRVHPDAENRRLTETDVRNRILDVIYRAIGQGIGRPADAAPQLPTPRPAGA